MPESRLGSAHLPPAVRCGLPRSHLPHSIAAILLLAGAPLLAQEPDPDEEARRAALERALAELPQEPEDVPLPPSTDDGIARWGNVRLLDISLDGMFAVGSSTEPDDSLQNLQGGGHDPRKRGFTVQNVELAIRGAVDPYFRAEMYLLTFIDPIEGETRVELEEAFFTTTSLPYGLELEGGYFNTEFGRQNPRHPHAWLWLDAPVIHTRIFGPDAARGAGARLGWLTPLPWFTELHFGVQNANGETMASFLANDEYYEERGVGGRPFTEREVASLADMVWLARATTSWDPGDFTTIALGASALFGPNASGTDGSTQIYGGDLIIRWTDGKGGRQAQIVTWESEILYRRFEADAFVDDSDPNAPVSVPADTLVDWGLYTQLDWRFDQQWAAGLRYEWATADGANYDSDTQSATSPSTDPFRDDRTRVSPRLTWQATEFSRVRLQYNYDRAEHLESGDAHTVWLGVEVALGPHAAHRF